MFLPVKTKVKKTFNLHMKTRMKLPLLLPPIIVNVQTQARVTTMLVVQALALRVIIVMLWSTMRKKHLDQLSTQGLTDFTIYYICNNLFCILKT